MEEIKEVAEKLAAKFYSDEEVCEDRRDWKRIAAECGAEFVGSGISRVVFKYGNYVIKLSHYGDFHQSANEVQVWKYYATTAAKMFFAPIIDYAEDFSYVIQEYVGRSIGECMGTRDALLTVSELVNTLEYYNVRHGDIHVWNVSISKKIFDYGLFDEVDKQSLSARSSYA